MTVETIYQKVEHFLFENVSWHEAKELFKKHDLVRVPVVDRSLIPVGILHVSHMVYYDNCASIAEVPWEKPTVVYEGELEYWLEEKLLREQVDYALIVDSHGCLVGELTEKKVHDILLEKIAWLSVILNQVLNKVNKGVNAINNKGEITLANYKWLDIHQLKEKEVLGEHISKRFPESSLLDTLSKGQSMMRRGLHFEKTGATVNVDYEPLVDRDRIVGSIALVDTKSRNVAFELESLESVDRYLSDIFSSLQEGIVAVDKQCKIIYCNSSYKSMFCETMVNVPLAIDDGSLCRLIKQTFDGGQACMEKNAVSDRGTPVDLRGIPIVVGEPIVGAVVIIQDKSEIKYLNERLEKANEYVKYLQTELSKEKELPQTFKKIVGKNKKFQEALAVAWKVAATPTNILLYGENGVGKELVTEAIHYSGPRKHSSLIAVNCAAIPEMLLESELFGYEEGAFTGAKKGGKPGKFELADGGTLFLDEIGDMSPYMQAKLLRVLQNFEIDRVGGTKTRKVDVRVIAATNRNLEEMMKKGQFREDLYYRLNVVRINIPPLRERKEDIPLLTEFFLYQFSQKYNKKLQLAEEALYSLKMHDWPGNIRELKNALEHCVAMVDDDGLIGHHHLPTYLSLTDKHPSRVVLHQPGNLEDVLEEAEKQAFTKAMELANTKTEAMKILGISRRTFYKKLAKLNL